MSADGKTIAIGAPLNKGNGNSAGHVRVYSINSTSGNWLQAGFDINGEAAGDSSGFSIAMSADGKTIAIGAILNDGNGKPDAGHVSVYSINSTSGNWTQVGLDIAGDATGDLSGFSVAMSADGKTIAIGSPYTTSYSGHVRVYSINSTSGNWLQVGLDIDGDATGDLSGYSIDMSADGKTIAIGTTLSDGTGKTDAGRVRVYSLNSMSGKWTQVGFDVDGEAVGDQSGYSVAMSADGKTITIGARFNYGNGKPYSGHVRVYSINSTSGDWVQVGLDIDGETAGDQSGWSVAMSADGKTIAIGAPFNDGNGRQDCGHVRVYYINSTSGNWRQVGLDIDGEDSTDQSGYSVAMSSDGETIAIGAIGNYGNGNYNAGHVRVYKYEAPTKVPTKTPTTLPTRHPTKVPTKNPTISPTRRPTKVPTRIPTTSPTKQPTKTPTISTTTPVTTTITTTECPNNCGLFGFTFFCPRRRNCNCGFIRRFFHWNGC
jgi:FG-GAP repeat